MMLYYSFIITGLVLTLATFAFYATSLLSLLGRCLGRLIERRQSLRRQEILGSTITNTTTTSASTSNDGTPTADQWAGIIGFFHPFASAGGGGERVLWQAVKATQARWPHARIIIYTSDHSITTTALIQHVQERFDIPLQPHRLHLLHLGSSSWVRAESYPRFTLLGQSLGSLRTGYEALALCVPDVFVETMGFAAVVAACAWLFPRTRTVAYVHYPTISTDMLGSLAGGGAQVEKGVNAGKGAGVGGRLKRVYWEAFARLYSRMGGTVDLVFANSSWTKGHLDALWGPVRQRQSISRSNEPSRVQGKNKEQQQQPPSAWKREIKILYPPCAVKSLVDATTLDSTSERQRRPYILSLAQFRPEKNHELLLHAFAQLLAPSAPSPSSPPLLPPSLRSLTRLVLIGSVRGDADARRVYELRLLARELGIEARVDFLVDLPWAAVRQQLGSCSVGANAMWNEHFGIGVVEYMAAGLVPVVHDSGGPRLDIVREEGVVGFRAVDREGFARGFARVLMMGDGERVGMRRKAREGSRRFSEEVFERGWVGGLEGVVATVPGR